MEGISCARASDALMPYMQTSISRSGEQLGPYPRGMTVGFKTRLGNLWVYSTELIRSQ